MKDREYPRLETPAGKSRPCPRFVGTWTVFKKALVVQVVWLTTVVVPHVRAESPRLVPLAPATEPSNEKATQLGKMLFFDKRLSGDATISCATCHDPSHAFTDGKALSNGYPGTLYFRNTPTLINAAKQSVYYWDGRMSGDDLPSLIRDHISEAHFMQADGRLVIERLRQVPEYESDFKSVFGGEPSYGKILDAIAAFVRSLESKGVPYDDYLNGDESALSQSATRGLILFTEKANCIACHHGEMLTDGAFHHHGAPPNSDLFTQPERQITYRRFLRTIGVVQCQTTLFDVGRGCVTKNDDDEGTFRTPSLREVSRTAPYMHNGVFATLDDVIEFYNEGAGGVLQPLSLSAAETTDLVAFLKSLSGESLGIEPAPSPDYQILSLPEVQLVAEKNGAQAAIADSYPRLAPLPDVPVPADNPITEAKVELGKLLFFDDRLSGDVGTSCASCHDPRLGWGDGNALSRGYAGTQHWRNSQTTINSAFMSKLFWAGETPSLESQAQSAITGNLAGNGDPIMIEERLAQIPQYVAMFQEAFGAPRPLFDHVLKAIATFERSAMISRDSPFDEYLAGDEEAMSEEAIRGLELFRGKANCIRCHNGALMTDEKYHNLGVPENPLFEKDPLRQVALRYQHFVRGVPENTYRNANSDLGLYYTTKRPKDRGRFRTPPLRYLEYTSPYMHNGAFETLEEVIEFYNAGGGDGVREKSELLEPLGLTDDEQMDLLEFLESLSGEEIRISPPELPSYEPSTP